MFLFYIYFIIGFIITENNIVFLMSHLFFIFFRNFISFLDEYFSTRPSQAVRSFL